MDSRPFAAVAAEAKGEKQSLWGQTMNPTDPSISPYLRIPRRPLGEVCRSLGHDLSSLACPHCAVRELCRRTDTSRNPLEDLVSPGTIVPPAKTRADFRCDLMMVA